MKLVLTAFAAALALVLSALGARREHGAIEQPIAFDHERHAQELGCLDCHSRAAEGPYATLPLVSACLLCHAEAQGEHPDEPKIREFAERDGAIPWVRVYQIPAYVFFSHRAHLEAGNACKECHGPVEERAQTAREVDLSMTGCMNCHKTKNASNDCLYCHEQRQ